MAASNVWDYPASQDLNNLPLATRTWANAFIGDAGNPNADYTSRYIFNRLLSSKITSVSPAITLVSNAYDGQGLADSPGVREHDAGYGTSLTARGNPTTVTRLGIAATNDFDITGTAINSTDPLNSTVGVTSSGTTNYTAAEQITPNSSATIFTSATYNSWLGPTLVSGPNGASVSIRVFK